MSITTQQYQKGIDTFEKMEWLRDGFVNHEMLKDYIKQHTLSILQFEYDILDREIWKYGNWYKKSSEPETRLIYLSKSQALQDQRTHLSKTINEIKDL